MEQSRREVQASKKEKEKVNTQQGTGVRCPACCSTTYVLNSVPRPEECIQGRYRGCNKCGLHFYTEEVIKRITKDS